MVTEIASEYGIHSSVIQRWKRELLESADRLNRTGLYRKAKEPSEPEVKIKHLIERIHTKHPFKGARRIRDEINVMKWGVKGKPQAYPTLHERYGHSGHLPRPQFERTQLGTIWRRPLQKGDETVEKSQPADSRRMVAGSPRQH